MQTEGELKHGMSEESLARVSRGWCCHSLVPAVMEGCRDGTRISLVQLLCQRRDTKGQLTEGLPQPAGPGSSSPELTALLISPRRWLTSHSWVTCRWESERLLRPLSFAGTGMMQSIVVPERRLKWGCRSPRKPCHPPCSPPRCAVPIGSRISQPVSGCVAGTCPKWMRGPSRYDVWFLKTT